MNTKLIFLLSLFGLAMAFATITLIPTMIEPFCWLLIFLICAYIIAKKCTGKYFLHGLLVSLVNAVWITSAHIIFFKTYVVHHTDEAALIAKMPVPDAPRLMMLMTGVIIGIISGIVLGFFSHIAAKLIKKTK